MFGGKDLANLLSGGKVGNKDASAETEGAEFAPRVDMTKRVQRYRAGQAPQWSGEGGSEGVQQREEVIVAMIDRGPGAAAPAAPMDRRLARLAAAAPAATTSSAATSRRRIYEAEVVVDFKNDADEEPRDKGEEEEEEDEEEEEEQGPKYRQPLQQPFRAGILVPAVVPSGGDSGKREIDSSSETGGDSDDSDDSEESEEQEEERVKPTFVPRAKRQTAADEEARQAAEEALLRSRAMSADERKQHTRALLSESLRRAEDQDARASDAATDGDSDAGLPDDSDPDGHTPEAVAAAETEYQAWRVRELRRLKRDFEAQEQQALEKADLQRRRNMSDEERRVEDEALGKFRRAGDGPGEAGAGGGKQAFMQRYYHKGAFYMDADSIKDAATDVRVNRDFHQPTGEDKFNKAALPAVMQVHKFGMRGRTKYTTLRDQDTTAREWPLDHAGGGGAGGGARAGGGRAGAGAGAGRGGGAGFRGLEERRDDDIDSAGRIKRPKL